MVNRVFGKTGWRVSQVGLGCWQFGGAIVLDGKADGWSGISDEESSATIKRAVELALQNSKDIQIAKIQASLAAHSTTLGRVHRGADSGCAAGESMRSSVPGAVATGFLDLESFAALKPGRYCSR